MRSGETFEQCEVRMHEMLAANGHAGSIVWTFCEDYIWDGKVLFVGVVDSAATSFAANCIFEDNARYSYGVEMSLIAVADGNLYCALRAPLSMPDAQYERIDGVKLTLLRHLFGAKIRIPFDRLWNSSDRVSQPPPRS